jgi:hypothetical protein
MNDKHRYSTTVVTVSILLFCIAVTLAVVFADRDAIHDVTLTSEPNYIEQETGIWKDISNGKEEEKTEVSGTQQTHTNNKTTP